MRILIAEDDFTSRGILAAVLKKAGFEPVETVNGLEAWETLQKPDAPRLAILDWIMPGMDGLEVVRKVRAVKTHRPPYLIMLTTRDEKADIIAGLDAGANDYLTKPFDLGELRARVEVGRRMVEAQNALAEQNRELRLAMAEIKTLRGIVPICSNCKKIRDDAGFWQQVEVYVRAHSEAEFSHGLCPECLKRLYPEYDEETEPTTEACHERYLLPPMMEAPESESSVHNRLKAFFETRGDIGELDLSDIIDIPAVQSLMENFHRITGMLGAIVDHKGSVLVSVGWQDICTRFHRRHPQTQRNCMESDTILARGTAPGTFKAYRCKNGMWDMASPIVVSGHHLGNIYFGQFFYSDETYSVERFRKQAQRYGFDEKTYLAALSRVPRYTRETVHEIMAFYSRLAEMISSLSFTTATLSRTIIAQKQAENDLRSSREILKAVLDAIPVRVFWKDRELKYLGCNTPFVRDAGLEKPEDLIGKDDYAMVWRGQAELYQSDDLAVIESGAPRLLIEEPQTTPSGETIHLLTNKVPWRNADGIIGGVLGTYFDITDRRLMEDQMRLLNSAVEQVTESIVITNENHKITYINQAAQELFGFSMEELKGQTPALFNAEPLSIEIQDEIYKTVSSGKTYMGSVQNRRKDGSTFLCEFKVAPIHDKDGSISHYIGLQRDITDRKRAEDEIRKFKTITDEAITGSGISDMKGNLLYVNKSLAEIHGYTPEELTGRNLKIFHTETQLKSLTRISRELRERGRFDPTEVWHVHRDGHEFPMLMSGVVSRDKRGEPQFITFSAEDLSAFKRTEAELQSTQEYSDSIIRSMADMLIVVSPEGLVLSVNATACRLLGFEEKELLGKPAALLFEEEGESLSQNTPPVDRTILRRLVREGYISNIEKKLRAKDGTIIPVLISGSVLRTSREEVKGIVCLALDIREMKKAEAEKHKIEAQLAQAQKMESIGRLAGGVAHDFNNMLGVIIGHTEMALEHVDPEQPLFADLLAIYKAAERSSDLTRQLLTFARKQTIAPRVIDLNETVEGMLNLLRRLIGEDIDLSWIPGKKLAPIRVDPTQIDQILANLCVNARDAISDVGRITIETDSATIDDAYCADHPGFVPGAYVILTVSDNGCGMDTETLGHLFEPFFTTKELGRGTGLGLAMVYGAVKQNKSFINVYSEPGQGTTFRIYFPRHPDKVDKPAENRLDNLVKRGHERILLVEDEPAVLKMITLILERAGYAVVCAVNPIEAIRLANENAGAFHLLLSDAVMPEMNGRDLANKIVSRYPDVKCLFMSGYTANVITQHSVLDEGVNFIQKPFSGRDLTQKVREVLELM